MDYVHLFRRMIEIAEAFSDGKWDTVSDHDAVVFALRDGVKVEILYDQASSGGASFVTCSDESERPEAESHELQAWFCGFRDGVDAVRRMAERPASGDT